MDFAGEVAVVVTSPAVLAGDVALGVVEDTVRQDGEDPSIFAIELETLAVRAFGDMCPSARVRMTTLTWMIAVM